MITTDSQESHELILIKPQGLKYIAPSTRTSLQHPHPATAPSSQATQELNLIKPQWLKLYNTRTSTQRPHQHPAPAPHSKTHAKSSMLRNHTF